MQNKSLQQALIFFIFSLLVSFGALWKFKLTSDGDGIQHTFISSQSNIEEISSISLKLPENTLVFDKEDNVWRVRNADSYPANYKLMNEFFTFIQSSAIYRQVDLDDAAAQKIFSQPVQITLTDRHGEELREVILGAKTPNRQMSYAQIKGQEGYYLVENNIVFPDYLALWLQQPLLSLSKPQIMSISINGHKTSRQSSSQEFKTTKLNSLIKSLEFVGFIDVLSAQNFDESAFATPHNITVTEFSGLIISLNIYKKGEEYWIKQKLSSAKLSQNNVEQYIKDSEFLYDYWYFRVSADLGQELYSATL